MKSTMGTKRMEKSDYCGTSIPPDPIRCACMLQHRLGVLCFVGKGKKPETRSRLWIHPWVMKVGRNREPAQVKTHLHRPTAET